MAALPHPWGEFEQLQDQSSQRSQIDNQYWGLDAALDALLDRLPGTSGLVQADVQRVISTTARRERHRARLRAIHLVSSDPGDGQAAFRAMEARDAIDLLRKQVANEDWVLLHAVAQGESYGVLATRRGVSPGSLRVRVSRLRRVAVALAA